MRKTIQQIIEEIKISNPKVEPLEDYDGHQGKIKCQCKQCGHIWEQTYSNLKRGRACPICARKRNEEARRLKGKSNFFNSIKDRSIVCLSEYINSSTKIELQCLICGNKWKATPNKIVSGRGCPECKKKKLGLHNKKTQEYIIQKFIEQHGDKYDYSKVEYKNYKTKVCIICPEHGEFWQTPSDHISGNGCPRCNQSHGESKICLYLNNLNVEYIQQYKLQVPLDISKKGYILVDFYIPSLNTFIEYNRIQHYIPIKHFGGELKFKIQQARDEYLIRYCKNKGINLKIIKYNENIQDNLNDLFNR